MLVVAILIAAVALPALLSALWSGLHVLIFLGRPATTLSELGQLGDFFGGHTAALVGSLTLLAVLFFSYHSGKQQQQFFERQSEDTQRLAQRQYFLDGLNVIAQWDLKSPGCDQTMRLLDYYARVALDATDEELLLLLNTVITAEVRRNLEGKKGTFKSTNYPFACEALERIGPLRERDGRAQRERRRNDPNPSTPGVPAALRR